MDYFHEFNKIKSLRVDQLVDQLLKSKKLQLKDVKFSDILLNIESLVGVYIFFDSTNKPLYVGKTEGRSFLERLAAHFDLRRQGYMNHFLKALTEKPRGKNSTITDTDIREAYHKLVNFNIVFISLHKPETIRALETALRQELQPIYNRYKSKKNINPLTLIGDL